MIEFAVEVIMIFLAGSEGAEKISVKMVTMCFSKVVILPPHITSRWKPRCIRDGGPGNDSAWINVSSDLDTVINYKTVHAG